jgi:uncharacterized protein YjgD (DUF1641 family)
MGQPIHFSVPPPDARAGLRERLARSPEEHADAVLAAYELLQVLHDRGVLDVATSALRASDELLATAVGSANTPDAIRAIRNLLFWRQVLGRIEPAWFQGIFQAIPDGLAMATAQRDEPLSLWKLLRRAISKDSLRGLAAGIDFLESFGRHLHTLEASARATNPERQSSIKKIEPVASL